MNARASFPLVGRRGRYERILQRHLDAVDCLLATMDAEDGDADLEPSLAGFNPLGYFDDREADDGGVDADEEPSLGSLGGTARSGGSQLGWAGGDTSEREEEHDGREPQCEDEDEGAQVDREPEQDHCVPCHLLHDQTRLGTYAGEAITPPDPDEDPGDFTLRIEVGLAR